MPDQELKHIEVMYPKYSTENERQRLLIDAVAEIKANGLEIVRAEPIEEIYVKTIGRKFIVVEKKREEVSHQYAEKAEL